MDLSKICINARARTPWEAVDLGIIVARAWWLPLFLIWFVPAFCLFIVLSALFSQYSWLAYLVVWWLKPFFDRGPLYIASRRLFGENVGFWQALRELPSLYRHDALMWLTLRRFSLTRSFDMPMTILEQLRGQARRSRQGVLHRKYGRVAWWLSIICIHVEMFLVFGVVSLLVIMIPEEIGLDYLELAVNKQDIAAWLYNIMAFLAMALVAPFYTISGFCLYISRRIDLEAWDIEIRFRHIAEEHSNRVKTQIKNTVSTGLSLLLFMSITSSLVMSPTQVAAQTEKIDAAEVAMPSTSLSSLSAEADPIENESPLAKKAKEDVIDIISGDPFHQKEEVSGWRFKDIEQQDDDEIPEWLIQMIEALVEFFASLNALDGIFENPAQYFELLLWGLMILVLTTVVYRYRQSIHNYIRRTKNHTLKAEVPDSLFGLDVRKESLPDDVAFEVMALWAKGQHRESVSLLYRSTLAALIHHYNFSFSASHTENECVMIVKRHGNGALSRYTADLTGMWQQLAYGHQLPSSPEVEKLCGGWKEVFPDD